MTSAAVEVHAATPERWPDVVTVFGSRGDPSWCWCQYFLTIGSSYGESAKRNKAALQKQVRGTVERPPGLLAYMDAEPVGWLQVGPRADFPRVVRNKSAARVLEQGDGDTDAVWRATCFVVRVGHRRHGVTRALLEAAVGFARDQGATALEGHPVDVSARVGKQASASLFFGVLSTFLDQGFVEVGRTGPSRPIVRRTL